MYTIKFKNGETKTFATLCGADLTGAKLCADKIEVSFEGFTVRCLPTKAAALALAAKLERNKNRTDLTGANLRGAKGS